jgi:hypothetical protein
MNTTPKRAIFYIPTFLRRKLIDLHYILVGYGHDHQRHQQLLTCGHAN